MQAHCDLKPQLSARHLLLMPSQTHLRSPFAFFGDFLRNIWFAPSRGGYTMAKQYESYAEEDHRLQDATEMTPVASNSHGPETEGVLEGVLDPVYEAKARVLNAAVSRKPFFHLGASQSPGGCAILTIGRRSRKLAWVGISGSCSSS